MGWVVPWTRTICPDVEAGHCNVKPWHLIRVTMTSMVLLAFTMMLLDDH